MSGARLPDSALPRCLVCGEIVRRPDGERVLHEIRGFTRPRYAGGANHIIARATTGRIVGDCCAERVQAGATDTQLRI